MLTQRQTIINSTHSPGQATAQINFRILHNLSKDVIYLEESFDSILHTCSSLSQTHHYLSTSSSPNAIYPKIPYTPHVQDSLEYRKTILLSSRLQIKSLQNRVQNLIALAFHLVTQNESRIFQQDSFSMHALALVSLLFIPLASVSSFLGTPYFNVPNESVVQLTHGPRGIMWGVGGATLGVFVLWLGWYWSKRVQIRKGRWMVRERLRGMMVSGSGGR
jgi:hypothetical protein